MLHLKLSLGELQGDFPLTLSGKQGGFPPPHACRIHGSLPRGRYRLRLCVRESVHNQFLRILRNNQPIEGLAIPFASDSDNNWRNSIRDRAQGAKRDFMLEIKRRYGIDRMYARRMAQRQVWEFEVPFVQETAGEVTLRIENCNDDSAGADVRFYHGDGVVIEHLLIERDPRMPPHTFRRQEPGLPMLDCWGWMAYLDFDNPDRRVASFSEIVQDAIYEAIPWGANLIEINPCMRDGHCFDFDADGGPVPGTVRSRNPVWNTERMRELFRLAHGEGMMVELFIFSIVGFREFREMPPQDILYFMQRVHQNLGCGATFSQTLAAIDGAIYEFFPHDAPRQTDEAWQSNPGVTQMISGGITGPHMELKNNGFSAGFANYTAHWVGPHANHTGFDALFPAAPYPQSFCRRPLEIGYSYLQGCAENVRPADRNCLRPGNLSYGFPGRDVSPDWIFAQLQGFAQRRWRTETDRIASALCWEAVSETICPPPVRRMVLAATQDPIRACLSGTLRDTGLAGVIDLRRELRPANDTDPTRLSRRHVMPADSRFLRHQDFELISLPTRDYTILTADLSRSARFHANGELIRLFSPLFVSTFEENSLTGFEEEWCVIEPGGALVEAEHRLRFTMAQGTLHETRRYRLFSDFPGVEVNIARIVLGTIPTNGLKVQSAMAPAIGWQVECRESTQHRIRLSLSDADDLLPQAACSIETDHAGIVNFAIGPDGCIRFESFIRSQQSLTLRILTASGHVNSAALTPILDKTNLWHPPVVDLPTDGSEIDIPLGDSWPSDTPALTRIVAVSPSHDRPCRVFERGWWHYRGITPSMAMPAVDYLRIHAVSGDPIRVARDSRIGGHVSWGWGCQYLLLISDVTCPREDWHRVRLRVAGTTPFVFAPRIVLASAPAEVQLDGTPWHYCDGPIVFLPNRKGEFTISWRYGSPTGPRLLRTFAVVNHTEITGNGHLRIQTALPDHVTDDPGHHGWFALAEINGTRRICRIAIGDVVLHPETEST